MNHTLILSLFVICLAFSACQNTAGDIANASPSYHAELKELSAEEYPDNPDRLIWHANYGEIQMKEVNFERLNDEGYFRVEFTPESHATAVILDSINLLSWIPSIPTWVAKDDYLAYLCVVNQEWNRQQVRFDQGMFQQKEAQFTRVDLARNCLNSYLWEMIAYAEDDGESKPYYHAWFDFPQDLYASLFEEKNGIAFDTYKDALVDWEEPESKKVNLDVLRTKQSEETLQFEVFHEELYPIKGERKKKHSNIVYPTSFENINDFLSDQTQFATFSPPGIYRTDDPRKTELGRFGELQEVLLRRTSNHNPSQSECVELEYVFKRKDRDEITRLLIGGIQLGKIPTLPLEDVHEGWQMPMGIANHSFYEDYQNQQANPSEDNPYFAFVLDEEGKFLDSHAVGIDGPLFHFDAALPQNLHLWVLAFERHSFVGHIVVKI